jgi:5-methyltetrahydrofolate--homocysteine methyltransferase
MKEVIEELKKSGLRDQVRVMIGGAPITQQYADDIGADLFAPDAVLAANRARQALAA